MVLEIIIFGAVTGVIVIVGRKLPIAATSSHLHSVPNNIFSGKNKAKDEIGFKNEIKTEPNNSEKNEMKKNDEAEEDDSIENEKELDEILKNIDFLGDNSDDSFWEPTFFEEETKKVEDEPKQSITKKFVAKVKSIGDGYELPQEKESLEDKKLKVDSKLEKPILKDENLVPRKILPKTPIGIGLTTDLTLRDLLAQANNSFAAKNFLKAEEFYIKAASYDPNNPKIYSRLGIIYLKQGKYHDAKESLKYAISLDDSTAIHFFNISIACMKLGEMDEAISHLKRAVSLEPDNEKYHEILKQIS